MVLRFKTFIIIINALVTSYAQAPNQGWGDGTITVDGSKIIKGTTLNWCAVSHDILNEYGFNYGDTVLFDNKKYIIKDKMNSRFRKSIDILINDDDSRHFKIKTNIAIWKTIY